MTKTEYLKKLKRALRPVINEERNKSLAYFSEVIDDRMEEGVSEEDAVAELESIEEAAGRIIAEAKAQGQLKPKRSTWEIALIVLGFPLWFPVLFIVTVVILTIYGLVWIVIGALFLLSVSLVISGVAGVFGLFMYLGTNAAAAFAVLAIGLVSAGLGIALFIPALYLAKTYAKATPVMWNKLIDRKAGF